MNVEAVARFLAKFVQILKHWIYNMKPDILRKNVHPFCWPLLTTCNMV